MFGFQFLIFNFFGISISSFKLEMVISSATQSFLIAKLKEKKKNYNPFYINLLIMYSVENCLKPRNWLKYAMTSRSNKQNWVFFFSSLETLSTTCCVHASPKKKKKRNSAVCSWYLLKRSTSKCTPCSPLYHWWKKKKYLWYRVVSIQIYVQK